MLDLPEVLRGGVESVLHNFNLNLLQLVNSHISSTEKPRRSCTIHSTLCGNPNERKPLNGFLILYKYYIHLPAPTGRRLQTPWIYQHQLDGITNSLIYRHQPEGSFNSLYLRTPTGWKHQLPTLQELT